ncbi:MAG: hypothetical protein H7Y33_07940 [Cytophagales bacterium]|nr:hypothetical protein [Rhizobacter sp.]
MTPTVEYTEMKAFLRFFSERFLDQRVAAAQDRPLAMLEQQERESPGRAASGLRMAVNNCMEISSSWPLSQIVALDAEMHAKGLLSLSCVRSRVWGRYAAMMKRGHVRTGDEFAVAQAVLADPSLKQSLPESQRQSLQAMVTAYGPAGRPARAAHIKP